MKKKISDGILARIWEEVRHINFNALNRQAAKTFRICLAGSEEDIAAMEEWLKTLDYPLAGDYAVELHRNRYLNAQRFGRRVHRIPIGAAGGALKLGGADDAVLRSALFVLGTKHYLPQLRGAGTPVYEFTPGAGGDLVEEIMQAHEEYQYALAGTFPAFRAWLARRDIRDTAMQNAGWALFTAMPNLVPNPGQVFTVPAEALSDFVVMTTNEMKMTFELVAISGATVNPLKQLPEIGIVLGMAKIAEMSATNLVGKIPGAGVVIKSGVAYAFTYAIGELVFLYRISGRTMGREFVEERAKAYLAEGKKFAEKQFKRARRQDPTED